MTGFFSFVYAEPSKPTASNAVDNATVDAIMLKKTLQRAKLACDKKLSAEMANARMHAKVGNRQNARTSFVLVKMHQEEMKNLTSEMQKCEILMTQIASATRLEEIDRFHKSVNNALKTLNNQMPVKSMNKTIDRLGTNLATLDERTKTVKDANAAMMKNMEDRYVNDEGIEGTLDTDLDAFLEDVYTEQDLQLQKEIAELEGVEGTGPIVPAQQSAFDIVVAQHFNTK